ncbi:hypothetical protein JYQ62_22095 [Nostoc sp. UHCC 0702]|nr:hypothetical protein JYQ62_22095 [Nostoc sp. UHCC 0702]
MITNLPFQVSPQISKIPVGNSQTGILEFQAVGGLMVGEQIEIDEAIASVPSPFVQASKLAVKIHLEQGIDDLVFCFDVVASSQSPDPEREHLFATNRIRYAAEIEAVNRISEQVAKTKKIAMVTAIIHHRLQQPKWDEEQTKSLSSPLFQAIWNFIQTEMSANASEENSAPTAEDVGKPPGAVSHSP